MKKYGVLYSKTTFPKGHKLEWLNYSMFTSTEDLKREVDLLMDRLNMKYEKDIYIPLDKRLQSGCVMTPEQIDSLAKELYESLGDIFLSLTGDTDCIRVVYGVFSLNEHDVDKSSSTHYVGHLSSHNMNTMERIGDSIDIKEHGLVRI